MRTRKWLHSHQHTSPITDSLEVPNDVDSAALGKGRHCYTRGNSEISTTKESHHFLFCLVTTVRVSPVHAAGSSKRVCAAGIDQKSSGEHAVAQDVQDQEEAGEEDAPEPPHSTLDPHEDRQHHQVQRQAQALASHKTRVLRAP
ncbi:uncharacterized protein LOC108952498 isoform X2 [Musa acuminata AAA Group]